MVEVPETVCLPFCQAIWCNALADLFYGAVGAAFDVSDGWRRRTEGGRLPENVTLLRSFLICFLIRLLMSGSRTALSPMWCCRVRTPTTFGSISASGGGSGVTARGPRVGRFARGLFVFGWSAVWSLETSFYISRATISLMECSFGWNSVSILCALVASFAAFFLSPSTCLEVPIATHWK